MRKSSVLLFSIYVLVFAFFSCTNLISQSLVTKKIYIPKEFQDNNFENTESEWCYQRSSQSDNFIVFWAKGYENNHPASQGVDEKYRVDIDDLLKKAEEFYQLNVYKLQFAETGAGKSNLDKYKILIMLHYTTEWMAFGAGYDDVIGALWVSPSTCKPVGSVIAHEIGHSFQYQVYADYLANDPDIEEFTRGFRYGFEGNGGNGFWEQTAQWQAMQCHPENIFNERDLNIYGENYHRHICHEDFRYSSYFIHYYWAQMHGIDFIGKLWRNAIKPEDPMQAYMHVTGINVAQFNDELFKAASKMVTFDIDGLRELSENKTLKSNFSASSLEDKGYLVSYEKCPGTTGYNVIPLKLPEKKNKVSVTFSGMVNKEGFNQVEDITRAGWRYGFVALLESGERVYGKMQADNQSTISFRVPKGCAKLWFVVTGAPKSYLPHAWDDEESNDDQWPYQVKFMNTDWNKEIKS